MQTSKGFTIIELLVVVTIIAVLTGIVLASVIQYKKKAQGAAALGELHQIFTVATEYYNDNGTFSNLYQDSRIKKLADSVKSNGYNMNFFDEVGVYNSAAGSDSLSPQPGCSGNWGAIVYEGPTIIYCADSSGYIGSAYSINFYCLCVH